MDDPKPKTVWVDKTKQSAPEPNLEVSRSHEGMYTSLSAHPGIGLLGMFSSPSRVDLGFGVEGKHHRACARSGSFMDRLCEFSIDFTRGIRFTGHVC